MTTLVCHHFAAVREHALPDSVVAPLRDLLTCAVRPAWRPWLTQHKQPNFVDSEMVVTPSLGNFQPVRARYRGRNNI
jgi:hypothetical protein